MDALVHPNISENRIADLVGQLADRISEPQHDRASGDCGYDVLVPILSGAYHFGSDLHRALHRWGVDLEICPVHLRRSGHVFVSSGFTKLRNETRRILFCDTILSTGNTAHYVARQARLAKEIGFAFLLSTYDPPKVVETISDSIARPEPYQPKTFIGMKLRGVPYYAVGYGLDRNQKMRGQPFISFENPSDEVPDSKLL